MLFLCMEENKCIIIFTKIRSSITVFTLIIIRNVSSANRHIRIISKGSCDTEDYDAENSAYCISEILIGIGFCNISFFLFLIK